MAGPATLLDHGTASAPNPVRPPPWRLSVRHLWLTVPFFGVAVAATQPIRDNSFLWHVRAGEWQLRIGEVIRTDPFSFTQEGAAWRTQSWLIELLYGLLENQIGGLAWVPLLLLMMSALALALVGLAVYREARSVAVTAGILFGLTWLGLAYLAPRPVLGSYLLLAALVIALQTRTLWAIPLLIWTWAAVHGSFALGVGLVVLWGIREAGEWRRWVSVAGASVLAASLTAHGLEIWRLLIEFGRSSEALMLIQEWAAPRLTEPRMLPYAAALAILLYGAAAGRLTVRDLWVVIPFVLFGLTAQRSIFPAAIVLAPFAGRTLRSKRNTPPVATGSPILNWALLWAIVVILLLVVSRPVPIDDRRFPLEGARALDPGPVFHDDRVGGYLIYAQWPERQVFVDDRAELFGFEGFERFIAMRRGGDVWRDVFEQYGIRQALVHEGEGLAEELRAEGWRVVLEDGDFVLLREG